MWGELDVNTIQCHRCFLKFVGRTSKTLLYLELLSAILNVTKIIKHQKHPENCDVITVMI